MRVLNANAPVYPERKQVNFTGCLFTDDVTNECTNIPVNVMTPGATVSGGTLSVTAPAAVNLGDATIAQGTNITTAVTINAASGVITTQSASAAAVSAQSFTVNNSAVSAASSVVITGGDYSGTLGTNGSPIFYVNSITGGSFQITIYNAHATAALAGTFKIKFVVA